MNSGRLGVSPAPLRSAGARLYSAAKRAASPRPRQKGRGHGHAVTILHALFPPAGVRAGLTTTAPATVLMSCDGRMDAMPFDGTTAQTTRRPKPHITARG